MDGHHQKKTDIYALVEQIGTQVESLSDKIHYLESENRTLVEENAALKAKLAQPNGSSAVSNSIIDVQKVKRKLEQHIREIDKCIAQLEE